MKTNSKIVIVDYGVGNLYSLAKAFQHFGADISISEEASDLELAAAIVLPGVGSFEAGMRGLKVRGLINAVKQFAEKNKPMLGICLGAQLMLGRGYEFGEFLGLDIIPGKVIRFPELENKEKIPQVGWNEVYPENPASWKDSILGTLPPNFNAYFVHSYTLVPDDAKYVLGKTTYGGYEFCSIIKRGNIYASQFHPEKSGQVGLEIIRNFIRTVS